MIVDNEKAKKRKRGVLTPYYLNYIDAFGQWMHRLAYAPSTIDSNTRKLDYFFEYIQNIGLRNIYDIEDAHITNYNKQLHKEGLSGTYIGSFVQAIRNFSFYLESHESYKLPLVELTIEKHHHQPYNTLTKKEIEQLFNSIENTPISMRDRATLHLLYSCGLRREEAARVRIKDLDYCKYLLYVQPGKTRKGRYVPLHPKVSLSLRDYEQYTRPIINPNGKYFLVNTRNNSYRSVTVSRSLERILQNSPITKSISPHSLRHSIATHLLQEGMEIEYIRQFLGHKSLQTTQMYIRMNSELLHE